MFLDDKLLQICENTVIETPEDVQKLNKKLFNECLDHYKANINENMSNKEVKATINRTFNLFDYFVRQAKKSGKHKLLVLAELFEEYNFKMQFLSHKQIANIYNKL